MSRRGFVSSVCNFQYKTIIEMEKIRFERNRDGAAQQQKYKEEMYNLNKNIRLIEVKIIKI